MNRGILRSAVGQNNLCLELDYQECVSLTGTEDPEIDHQMIVAAAKLSLTDEFNCLLKMM